jgi:hypothetical protein
MGYDKRAIDSGWAEASHINRIEDCWAVANKGDQRWRGEESQAQTKHIEQMPEEFRVLNIRHMSSVVHFLRSGFHIIYGKSQGDGCLKQINESSALTCAADQVFRTSVPVKERVGLATESKRYRKASTRWISDCDINQLDRK